MSKLSQNYIAVNEGRMARAEFVRQARQMFPNAISQYNSFEDAISILKTRGLLTEGLEACNVNPDQLKRGVRFELEKAGVCPVEGASAEDIGEATKKATANLCKDPLYYIRKVEKGEDVLQEGIESPDWKRMTAEQVADFPVGTKLSFMDELSGTSVHIEKVEDNSWKDENGVVFTDEEVVQGVVHPDAHDHKIEEAATEDVTHLNKAFLEMYIKYKDGNYKVKNKETGELEDGKKLAPETAAQRACIRVRQAYNAPRFRPDRNTIKSCSVGRGKLEYQGERNGVPSFNYAWSLHELSKNSSDPVWSQFYNFYKKQGKSDHEAKILANDKLKKYQVKHNVKEAKKPEADMRILKENISGIIKKVLEEAATANLAHLSDENASIQEVPAILNNFENVVTEIESFILKEQQKIQGLFDSIGNIKNEDNIPIGYKFVEPIMAAFKKDLEPVLAKISLDNLNLPEAPAADDQLPSDPDNETGMDTEPEAEPKQTVFSPAAEPEEKETLAENKKPRRKYTA